MKTMPLHIVQKLQILAGTYNKVNAKNGTVPDTAFVSVDKLFVL